MPDDQREGLSSTGYVMLGLLCVQDWSAYELARQMERGWVDIWPRASSGIYTEPKKLVARGLAVARPDRSTGRQRTVYSVTQAGRSALRAWLAESSQPPRMECEALVRVLFADQGGRQELLAAIRALREHATARSRELLEQGQRDYLSESGPFSERRHLIQLGGGFLAEYFGAIIRWADWAEPEVLTWQDSRHPRAADQLTRQVEQRFTANLGEGHTGRT